MARPLPPLLGIRSGMLVVVKDLGTRKEKQYKRYVLCQCDCGNTSEVWIINIRTGHTTSCGCIKSAWQKSGQTIHGMCRTPEHGIWSGIRDRCYNPNNLAYHNYGSRGIKMCERWRNSFQNFFEDMGPRPSKSHSIDRFPDNNGDYGPANCRWATTEQQALNKRTNVYYEYDGIRLTQCQWARFLGVKRHMILNHIRRGKTFHQTIEYLKINGLVKI